MDLNTVEARIKGMVVVADDDAQKRVVITKLILTKAERLLRTAGLPEESLTPSIHHAMVGMVAYLMVNTIDPKNPKEIRAFLSRYRSLVKRMRFAQDETMPGEEDQADAK